MDECFVLELFLIHVYDMSETCFLRTNGINVLKIDENRYKQTEIN